MGKSIDPAVASEEMRQAGVEPLEPYPGAGRRWRCRCMACGRETSPALTSVRSGHAACRYCAQAAVQGVRKVDEKRAVNVMRAAGVEPLVPYLNSKAPWLCRCTKCGAEVTPTYNSVAAGNRACRFCSKKQAGEKQRRDPAAAAKIMLDAGFEPLVPYTNKATAWPCRCTTCGRTVKLYLDNVMNGKGCRWCSRKAVDPAQAAEVMRAAGLDPLVPYPRAHEPWPCRCMTCGLEVSPSYGSVRGGSGCKYCAGRAVDIERALQVMHEALLDPLEPYPGTKPKWRCRCLACNREVTLRYGDVIKGHGCAYCARKAVDPVDARELMEAAGLKPLEPYPGAGAPWRCECTKCHRIVLPRYGNIRAGWGGCAFCTNQKVDPELAVAAALAVGLQPREAFPGGTRSWSCICLTCNRAVAAKWASIRGGSGCRYCADFGFWSGDGPALVYLLTHSEWAAVKIGIARERTGRVEDHRRGGWAAFRLWDGLEPELAFQAEQAVLRSWRIAGIPDAVSRELMPQGGHTETAPMDIVDLARTCALVDEMVRVRTN